ncbi:MAG: flagellar transcriptional regulator FlhD [Chloroflexi bacterium]|jgi:flagellar transcriptional activator FlhD|nr:flagellar transcriptional regulator FlhD [Chloroflexota bacterium]
MRSAELHNEMKELNLAYLMLAQQLIREDRDIAMFRLGISDDIAELLGNLTPGQVLKMSGSDMLLCRFRFDDRLLLGLLSSHDRESGMARLHAMILAADKPVEAIA